MPITRTIMTDDDGSGTTGTILNNAWLQTIYNQIDALAGATATLWTPVDLSGASLVFTGFGYTLKIGTLVSFWCDVTFPATSDTRQAFIGGLPYTAIGISGGGYTTYGLSSVAYLGVGYDAFYLFTPSVTPRTNAELSSSHFVCAGQYLTS